MLVEHLVVMVNVNKDKKILMVGVVIMILNLSLIDKEKLKFINIIHIRWIILKI